MIFVPKNLIPLFQDLERNFTKFLVDQNGRVIKRYSPRVKPTNIAKDIEKLLENKVK